jgi:dTDP-4-amino-4,6-dideoxygalactose transaminase
MGALLDRGVSTRRGIMNIHQEPAYAHLGPQHLPHSVEARDRVILLPLYHDMTEAEQQYVIDQLADLSRSRKAG